MVYNFVMVQNNLVIVNSSETQQPKCSKIPTLHNQSFLPSSAICNLEVSVMCSYWNLVLATEF